MNPDTAATLANRAPGSLKDYVEPTFYEKEFVQNFLLAALLGLILIYRLWHHLDSLTLGYRPEKHIPSETMIQYYEEPLFWTPSPSPTFNEEKARPYSPMHQNIPVTELSPRYKSFSWNAIQIF